MHFRLATVWLLAHFFHPRGHILHILPRQTLFPCQGVVESNCGTTTGFTSTFLLIIFLMISGYILMLCRKRKQSAICLGFGSLTTKCIRLQTVLHDFEFRCFRRVFLLVEIFPGFQFWVLINDILSFWPHSVWMLCGYDVITTCMNEGRCSGQTTFVLINCSFHYKQCNMFVFALFSVVGRL